MRATRIDPLMAFLDSMKAEIDRHLGFWIVFLLAFGALFLVPQLTHVWGQFEPNGMTGWELATYVSFLCAVIGFYLVSTIVVLRPFPLRRLQDSVRLWARARAGRFPLVVVGVLWWIPEMTCRALPSLRERMWRGKPGTRNPRTAVVLLVIASLGLFLGAPADSSRLYPLAGVLCRNVGFVSLLASLWLAFPSSTRREHDLGPSFGRFLSWLVLTTLFGEVIWGLGCFDFASAFSYRLFSIWAMCHLAGLGVLIALLVDRLHDAWKWPVRPVAVCLATLAVLVESARPSVIRATESSALMSAEQRRVLRDPAPTPEWRAALLKRIRAIPVEEGPVVLVAASGGGSRAAIFAALAIETLHRTPLGGGPITSGAIRGRSFGDNVVLMSSVSGGALATAYHLVARARGEPFARVGALRSTGESELVYKCLEDLQDQLRELELDERASPSSGRPTRAFADDAEACREAWRQHLAAAEAELKAFDAQGPASSRERRGARALIEERIENADQRLAMIGAVRWLAALRAGTPPLEGDASVGRVAWCLHSASFDAMCTDFMAPLLRGMVSVVLRRDDALTRFWTHAFGWQGTTNQRGFADGTSWSWGEGVPLAVFNATDVARGRRLAIGFPPLPRDLWRTAERTKSPTRLGPIALDAIAHDCEISLARAVRMSSNFPLAFPVQELARTDGEDPVHILDGGVVDNTGIDTLRYVFRAFEFEARRAKHERATRPSELTLTEQILAELRARRVLIFEIDSGAKPDEGLVRGLLAGALEPMNALNNAAYSQAERAKREHIDEIRRIVSGEPDQGPASRRSVDEQVVLREVFQCNEHDRSGERTHADVMTAWTLGPHDKAEILTRFFQQVVRWDRSRLDLRKAPGVTPSPEPAQERLDQRLERAQRLEKRATGAKR